MEEETKDAAVEVVVSRKRKLSEKQIKALEEGRLRKKMKDAEKRRKEEAYTEQLKSLESIKEENLRLKEEIVAAQLQNLEKTNEKLKTLVPAETVVSIQKVAVEPPSHKKIPPPFPFAFA